jgi:hypothetical protein
MNRQRVDARSCVSPAVGWALQRSSSPATMFRDGAPGEAERARG